MKNLPPKTYSLVLVFLSLVFSGCAPYSYASTLVRKKEAKTVVTYKKPSSNSKKSICYTEKEAKDLYKKVLSLKRKCKKKIKENSLKHKLELDKKTLECKRDLDKCKAKKQTCMKKKKLISSKKCPSTKLPWAIAGGATALAIVGAVVTTILLVLK